MEKPKSTRASRLPVVAAVIAMTVAAGAQAAKTEEFKVRTAGDLVNLCATAPSDPEHVAAVHFCQGYTVGAYAYYAAVTAEQPDGQYVCVTQPYPSRASVLQEFVAWAKGKPEMLKEPAVDALFRFLEGRFPCKR
jgi:hypothetical protein